MTYLVDFSWTYEYLDGESGQWEQYKDFDARRFHCKKKDIKKEVRKYVEQELEGETYKDLEVIINKHYLTTEHEV